jgi:hypothetical protein
MFKFSVTVALSAIVNWPLTEHEIARPRLALLAPSIQASACRGIVQ